jgi:tRNA dimethylallyltransferase
MNQPPLIALTGPTASGKTAAALALAQRWPVEIISVDSALVYRDMNIGTAKPSAQERSAVPHHLIDIRDPVQAYSAADFRRDALVLIEQIQQRGHRPLLVGGTLLYLKALTDGLHDMPTADPAVREEIARQAQAQGWRALHAQLAEVDPVTAERLPPGDTQRIARALEVWRVSGQPLSSFHRKDEPAARLPVKVLSLEPLDRSWLHHRIALRFEQMLGEGLLEEVWALMQRDDLHADLPSMRCVGYRQCWQVLDQTTGVRPAPGAPLPNLSQSQRQSLLETGIAATRQLAKRQLTWLRSMPERYTLACDAGTVHPELLKRVQTIWGSA